MPKIEIEKSHFFDLLGHTYSNDELERVLVCAKAELAEAEGDLLKIELNDTNRPDLWSSSGLARALVLHTKGNTSSYNFAQLAGRATKKVAVEKSVQSARPYLAGFVARGAAMSDAMLKDIIQSQEKLCWNFGQKRATVSMGVYRAAHIVWPVRYFGVDPTSVSFTPLQGDRPMNLLQILDEHPKGKEYGFINKGLVLHPFLTDAQGKVLSYPPIINSADIGAVHVGDTDLFIELTGTDLTSVALLANIVACDFIDNGYSIEPIEVSYPYDTPFGRSITFPHCFQKPVSFSRSSASKLLGKELGATDIVRALTKMGSSCTVTGDSFEACLPPYRNDYIHVVDAIEDVMMGMGMESFAPERPHDFTIGRLSGLELFTRSVKSMLTGLGYQEMVYNYLISGKFLIERMKVDGAKAVRIDNPMSENFEYLRDSALPSLLNSEAVSTNAAYPHRIYEIGKVAHLLGDAKAEALSPVEANYGIATRQHLACISAHDEADYNEIASHLGTLLFYLGCEHEGLGLEDASRGALHRGAPIVSYRESKDPRFILGRQAAIVVTTRASDSGAAKETHIGIMGEVHPEVLEAWSITMPLVAAELDLDLLLRQLAP